MFGSGGEERGFVRLAMVRSATAANTLGGGDGIARRRGAEEKNDGSTVRKCSGAEEMKEGEG